MSARLRGLLALGLCLCLALLPAPARAAAPTTNWADNADTTWYGDGSAAAFTISTAAELAGLAKLTNDGTSPKSFAGKTVTLAADVDLSAHLWTPISEEYGRNFSGTFDGAGHTVSGLIISKSGSFSDEYAGFFGNIETGGTVHSLRIVDASVSNQAEGTIRTGILAAKNSGAIYDCAASGGVTSDNISGSAKDTYAADWWANQAEQ